MTDFLIASLAVWRVSRFIRKEHGPGCFMSKLRHWCCRNFCNADGSDDGTIVEWFQCNKCASVWIATAGVVAWYCAESASYPIVFWLAMPFAMSAATFAYEYLDEMSGWRAKTGWQKEIAFDAGQREPKSE